MGHENIKIFNPVLPLEFAMWWCLSEDPLSLYYSWVGVNLYVCVDALHPSQQFSVMSGWFPVFHGWTSTKQRMLGAFLQTPLFRWQTAYTGNLVRCCITRVTHIFMHLHLAGPEEAVWTWGLVFKQLPRERPHVQTASSETASCSNSFLGKQPHVLTASWGPSKC